MYAVPAILALKPGTADQISPSIRTNGKRSFYADEHCDQSVPCADKPRPHGVLHCDFDSETDALNVHLKNTHFLDFDAVTADWIVAKDLKTFRRATQ